PLFTQDLCQHARVACGTRRFQNGNGITRLKASSPRSLDAPSVIISVRVSIKPSRSPLHCSRSTSRDFVPWRFSDACGRCPGLAVVIQASEKPCMGRFLSRGPQGSYPYSCPSLLVYSISSPARARSDGGTVRTSSFAVLRLITSSYLVGCCTG